MIKFHLKTKIGGGEGKLDTVWIFAFYDIRFKLEEKPGMEYKLILFNILSNWDLN